MVRKGVGVQIYTIMCFIRGVRIEGRLESWQVVTRLEGFAVNGVRRGTRINDANSTVEERCAWRSSTWLGRVHSGVGFRLNGDRRGGVYNDYARYCKCVYRNNYVKASGHREIGFL